MCQGLSARHALANCGNKSFITSSPQSDKRRIPWNVLNVAKLATTFALVVISVVEIAYVGVADSDDDVLTNVFTVDYVTPVVFVVTYVASFSLTLLTLNRGVRTSPSQFFLFLTSLICGAITFR